MHSYGRKCQNFCLSKRDLSERISERIQFQKVSDNLTDLIKYFYSTTSKSLQHTNSSKFTPNLCKSRICPGSFEKSHFRGLASCWACL